MVSGRSKIMEFEGDIIEETSRVGMGIQGNIMFDFQ